MYRRSSYTQTVAPAIEPLDLCDVKEWVGYPDDDRDQELETLIAAARKFTQEMQWSQLISATWVQRMDCFPDTIELHPNPVTSVTSVAYTDTAGDSQTLTVTTDYTVDTTRRPCVIYPAYNTYWPATRGYENDVVVTFVAGYGTGRDDIPPTTRQGMLMLVKQWYDGCGNELPMMTRAMLEQDSFKVMV